MFITIEPVNIVDSSSSSSDDYSGNLRSFIVRVSFRIWAEGGEMAICNLIGWGEGIALLTCIALENVSSREGARGSEPRGEGECPPPPPERNPDSQTILLY